MAPDVRRIVRRSCCRVPFGAMDDVTTPRADGFAMPAEFDAHQATWMSWPTNRSLWDGHLDAARDEWAATARAVAAFEPVVMVCNAGEASDVLRRCGEAVEPLELPIDDSWLRDNGPIFVRNDRGELALVHFELQLVGGEVPALRRRTRGSRSCWPRTSASAGTGRRSSSKEARSSSTARARS